MKYAKPCIERQVELEGELRRRRRRNTGGRGSR